MRTLIGFTFFFVCLSSRGAGDDNLLMLAAQVNYMKAVQARCDGIIPGYAKEFQTAYATAKDNMFDEVGLTDEVLARAASIPELATKRLVEKFDRQEQATQKLFCSQNLRSINEAAVAKKEGAQ